MKPRTMIQLIVILSTSVLSACTGGGSEEVSLEGTSWVLTTINGERTPDHTRLTIKFDDGNIFGECGKKSYSGLYLVVDDAIRLGVMDLLKSGSFCPWSIGPMPHNFSDTLESVERFEMADDVLALFTDDGQKLTFEVQ